jgi:hypothetical protein
MGGFLLWCLAIWFLILWVFDALGGGVGISNGPTGNANVLIAKIATFVVCFAVGTYRLFRQSPLRAPETPPMSFGGSSATALIIIVAALIAMGISSLSQRPY